jgi:serine/threonine protein kinase
VFIQLILALRYLHKEKGIVHRDLTANNIMLDDEYRVKISEYSLMISDWTRISERRSRSGRKKSHLSAFISLLADFGLAKLRDNDCSKMTSVVGTLYYACPEIVQHMPYNEKAGWSS